MERINTQWSIYLKDPRFWLRLCIKKEAKWFKDQAYQSNQNFKNYNNANLHWYDFLAILDESQEEGLKKSVLMHLKLRFKIALKLTGAFNYIHITPFAFAAKYGNLVLAQYIVTNTDPFKKMRRFAMIDVEQGEFLDNEIIPFDPSLIPIHTATRFGQFKVVKFLMETYSHLNEAIDEFDLAPIEYAILKLLLRFPLRDDIKRRAYNLAMDKQLYAMAFEIDRWNWNAVLVVCNDALESRVGNCYFFPTILVGIGFIILIWAFIILYTNSW